MSLASKNEATEVYLSGNAHEILTKPLTSLDRVIRYLLSPYLKWDSEYFVHIAERGYTHEKIFAFYPVFPMAMKALSNLFPFLALRTALLLSGFLVSNACNIMACVFLFNLTNGIFHNEKFSSLVVFFYGITPASIFTMALYTEPIFAFLTFAGMFFSIVKEQNFIGTLFFVISSGVRSNGVLNALFIFYSVIGKAWTQVFQPDPSPPAAASSKPLSSNLPSTPPLLQRVLSAFFFVLVPGGIMCVAIALPSVFYEEYAFHAKCVVPFAEYKAQIVGHPSSLSTSSISSPSAADVVQFLLPSLFHRVIRRTCLLLKIYPIINKSYIPPPPSTQPPPSPLRTALSAFLFGGFNDSLIHSLTTNPAHFASTLSTTLSTSIPSSIPLPCPRKWCALSPRASGGSIYGHVQQAYWGVGFLKYFALLQLGNHLLAWPIMGLGWRAVYLTGKAWLGERKKRREPAGISAQPHQPLSPRVFPVVPECIPFAIHLAIMLLMYVVVHAQVMTRFLNNSPVLFWFFASIAWDLVAAPASPSPLRKESSAPTGVKVKNWLLIFFCIGYTLVGSVLFTTFNPWT